LTIKLSQGVVLKTETRKQKLETRNSGKRRREQEERLLRTEKNLKFEI